MADDRSTRTAAGIVDEFARSTGLEGGGAPRRYLWTDAFAVCTCLSLHARTGERRHLERARALIDQVHGVLGRHRADGPRTGWLSGLPDAEGALHPTLGGLRIGKALRERAVDEPYDPDLEWDRDGQYFHYLTKWMHALDRAAVATGETKYQRWAAELATTAHARFAQGPSGARRLVWKMSVDLTRPLVPATGQHDPLDGLITLLSLQASTARDPEEADLDDEIAELEPMCAGQSWATHDELGIGGLLTDALRLAKLVVGGRHERSALLVRVCDDAAESLDALGRHSPVLRPLATRLPFRELGLAIGLHAVERLRDLAARGALEPAVVRAVARLERDVPLATALEDAWQTAEARRVPTWTEHADINAVTLAASLAPEGYLGA